MELRKIFKKKTELRVYGYDNFEGDKGIITAKNYEEAVKVYKETYEREITDNYDKYVNGGCYLFDLGIVEKGRIYITTEW